MENAEKTTNAAERETARQPRHRIESYNALKGIGALGILFSHMSYLSGSANPFWNGFYSSFMRWGSACCSLFFLCSGFLSCYTWKPGVSFGKYFKGKLKRLYPLTFLVFLLALAVELILPGNDVVNEGVAKGTPLWFFNILANLFLFKAFVPLRQVFYSFHGPSWYVSVLVAFYAAAYPFVKGLRSGGENERKRWRRAVWAVCIVSYLAEFAVCRMVDADLFGWNKYALYLSYVNPYFRILGEGFAGVLLCEYLPLIRKNIAQKTVSVLEIAGVITFFLGILLHNVIHTSLFNAWLQIVFMGFTLFAFCFDSGIVSSCLHRRQFQWLGSISFELYMTHAFVYEGLPVAVGFVSGTGKGWLIAHAGTRFMITLVLCIVVAWIAHILLNAFTGKVLKKNP